MIRIFVLLAFLASFAFEGSAADAKSEAKWYIDLAQGQAAAKKENKLVFIDFTGSDWCGWCMKLKSEVFTTPEFVNYARTNLVLVEIDLPRFKPISPEALAKNEALQAQFRAEGLPTLIVLDPQGKELWRLGGYAEAKPAQWIQMLDSLKTRVAVPAKAQATTTSPPRDKS
jgi:thioredoxin-related protein